jgi:hypothetical protein
MAIFDSNPCGSITYKIYKIDFRICYVLSKFKKFIMRHLFAVLTELPILQCPVIH